MASEGDTNEQIMARWKGQLQRDLADALSERDNIERRIERLRDGIKTFDNLLPSNPPIPHQENT